MKEIIKSKAGINEIENNKLLEKVSERVDF